MNAPSDETPEIITHNTEGSYFVEDDRHNINMHELPQTGKVTSFKVPLETTNNRIMYKTENGIDTNDIYLQNSPMQNSVMDNSLLYENYKYDLDNSVLMDRISRNHVNKTNEAHIANLKLSDNNKYTAFNSQTDNTVSYNLEKNTGWDMSYLTNTDPNMYMNLPNAIENGKEAYPANYDIPSREMYQSTVRNATLQVPTNQMNKSPNYNQTVPVGFKQNGNHKTYPNVEKTVVHTTTPGVNEASPSVPYNNSVAPTVYNFNANQGMGSLFGRTHGYTPAARNCVMYPETPDFMNFKNQPMPYVNHSGVAPMSPQMYYLMKENQNQCFLKKGMQSLMNVCNKNNKMQMPKYEYIVKGPSAYPPFPMYQDPKRFDVFKKITLQVGTCLDDVVNLCIDTLGASLRKFNHNNEVNLHDLYPFYNPDPLYTRPERPTLKTGNNFIDNINVALDSTTLEKHKNVPNSNSRIPIPRTQKTGFVVVDGVNNILDNLLNDPDRKSVV